MNGYADQSHNRDVATSRALAGTLAALIIWMLPLCAWAQEEPAEPPFVPEEETGIVPQPLPEESAEPAPAEGAGIEQVVEEPVSEQPSADQSLSRRRKATDPCQVRAPRDEEPIDQFRREIFETVCETAARFDAFFGNQRFDEEARRTHGRAGLRVIWDEHDEFEVDGTLKVRVDFPNLDQRLNAFLGREDRDDFLAGAENDLSFLPTFFEREGGQEWLLGLGYRPVGTDRSSLDFDVGVEADFPLDPFVRGRYRYYWLLTDENLLRARQTVYWTNQKNWGSGTRLDFERPISDRTLGRWTGEVVFDGETEGGDWNSGVTIFHGFSPYRAVSWFVGVDGETGHEVPIRDYGTRFTYRQRMLREWFFGEVITGVTWPRDTLEEQREMSFHIGFGFEIQFSGEAFGLGQNP